MKIMDMLKKELIVEDLISKNKQDVLAELSEVLLTGSDIKLDTNVLVKVLLEREKLGSTGIGDGIAIPHGKIDGLADLIVAFGRSIEGIAFDAMDNRPVHIFFLLMAPENSAGVYLKTLAKLSKMLKDVEFRKTLMAAKTKDDLYDAIARKDEVC
ncbi:MAG: PTS sugar transporter subunit IIA [Deltaproteobacteria bacterium]|nr:PTS sugar transporter subunit IIA [Deltaproteobacteria bacterium]